MVGWGSENTSFVLELTFNYGITDYKRGNDIFALVFYKWNEDDEDMEEKLLYQYIGNIKKVSDDLYRVVNHDFIIKFEDTTAETE